MLAGGRRAGPERAEYRVRNNDGSAVQPPRRRRPPAEKEKPATRKKKPAKMTRQQEIDRSIDRGTVPARYRSSVPKEYQQYVPFDKR